MSTGTQRQLGVLVGVDGSESSLHTVDWAVAEASARALPLTIVHVADLPPLVDVPTAGVWYKEYQFAAERMVTKAVARAEEAGADNVSGETTYGRAGHELILRSREADLVVVGARGSHGYAALLLGSVSAHVAAHAAVPVAVIRHTAESSSARPGIVVVGVDARKDEPDAHTVAALRYACGHAMRYGLSVSAVHAYPDPVTQSLGMPPLLDSGVIHQAADEALERLVAPIVADFPGVTVTRSCVAGHPGRVLVDASVDAELTVVGSRGHSGYLGLLLGSVSQSVLLHATSSVVVAR